TVQANVNSLPDIALTKLLQLGACVWLKTDYRGVWLSRWPCRTLPLDDHGHDICGVEDERRRLGNVYLFPGRQHESVVSIRLSRRDALGGLEQHKGDISGRDLLRVRGARRGERGSKAGHEGAAVHSMT